MLVSTQIDIESLVKTKLPPLPGSVIKISALLQDVNSSPRAIAETISYDPMLAARILRLANSPVYALERNITTLNQAVAAIGNKAIYEMVMVGATTETFGKEIRDSKIGRDNWEHSIAVATVARELCQTMKMQGTEQAFVCGLLHDIGKVLLLRADSELYTSLHDAVLGDDLIMMENEFFGFNHAQVGALATQRWGLPEPFCQMILNHHRPALAQQALFMTYVISVADDLAYTKMLPAAAPHTDDEPRMGNTEALATLRLSSEQIEQVWEKSSVSLREMIQTFS